MKKQFSGIAIVILVALAVPTLVAAESNFSIPAGAASGSNGFSTPAGAADNGSSTFSSTFSTPAGSASNTAVRGQVTDIRGDTYTVRDEYGREMRIQQGIDTQGDYMPRLGDNVEAQLNNGRASSLVRAPGASEGSTASGAEGSSGGK
jgi:hypothetical protein